MKLSLAREQVQCASAAHAGQLVFHTFPAIDTVEYSKEHAVLQLCICLLITVGNLSIQLTHYKVRNGNEIHEQKPKAPSLSSSAMDLDAREGLSHSLKKTQRCVGSKTIQCIRHNTAHVRTKRTAHERRRCRRQKLPYLRQASRVNTNTR